MKIRSLGSQMAGLTQPKSAAAQKAEFKQKLNEFVGETMYGTMLKTLRESEKKPAYFYGGQAEDVFGQQLDQVLAEKLGHTVGAKQANQAARATPVVDFLA